MQFSCYFAQNQPLSYLLTTSVHAMPEHDLFLLPLQIPNSCCTVSRSGSKKILTKPLISSDQTLMQLQFTYISRIPGANKDLFIMSFEDVCLLRWNLDPFFDFHLKEKKKFKLFLLCLFTFVLRISTLTSPPVFPSWSIGAPAALPAPPAPPKSPVPLSPPRTLGPAPPPFPPPPRGPAEVPAVELPEAPFLDVTTSCH